MKKTVLFCFVLISIKFSFGQVVYTFNGNGNWNDSANWVNKSVPPANVLDSATIIINPVAGGECILNTPQYISKKAKLDIMPGKAFRLTEGFDIYDSLTTISKNILAPNAHLIDTSQVYRITDDSLVLAKGPSFTQPAVGDIYLASATATNEMGILRKIVSFNETAGEYRCSTVPANLTEAFDQLFLDYTDTDSFTANAAFRPAAGQEGGINLNIGRHLTITLSNDNSIAEGIRLNGVLHFNIPTVKFEYKRKKGSLSPEKIILQADLNTDGSSLEITNTDKSSEVIAEKNIKTFVLPKLLVPIPIPTPIGVIIFRIPFSQKLLINTLPISISAKASWTTLPKISATLGCKYENGQWSNLSAYAIDASSERLSKGNFAPSLEVTGTATVFKPRYEISPFGADIFKGFFEVPNNLILTLQTATPNYSLKYNLDVKGGVQQSFYTGAQNEYSISGTVINKTILEGNWDSLALTTFPVSAITTTTAVSGGNISNDGDLPIIARGVCWDTLPNPTIANNKTNNGIDTGSFTSNLTELKKNKTYYVRAYAINSSDTAYGAEVSFKTDSVSLLVSHGVWKAISGGNEDGQILGTTGSYSNGTINCGPITYYDSHDSLHIKFNGDGTGTYSQWDREFGDNFGENCELIPYSDTIPIAGSFTWQHLPAQGVVRMIFPFDFWAIPAGTPADFIIGVLNNNSLQLSINADPEAEENWGYSFK